MSSTAGIKKANVLPEPVLAAPTKSLPSKSIGIHLDCISVNLVNPISFIPLKVFLDILSFKESKVQSLNISKEQSAMENMYLLISR